MARFRTWLGRGLLCLTALATVAAGGCAALQALATAADKRNFPPPGRLVSVAGARLHIDCVGAAQPGRPTVILVSGSDSPSPVWARIRSDIAPGARVCAYDRAGTGWSAPAPGPRDPTHIAQELAALLGAAGERGPLVVVGHSSGGLYARAFQRLYPARVWGLVLVDATHEDYFTRTPEGLAERQQILRLYAVSPTLARLGLIRLSPICRLPAGSPARPAAEFHALCSNADSWVAERAEMRDLTAPLPPATGPLTVPLAVVTAGENLKTVKPWGALQDRLAALSPESRHIVVAGANHSSLLLDAGLAHVTSGVILQVLRAAHAPGEASR